MPTDRDTNIAAGTRFEDDDKRQGERTIRLTESVGNDRWLYIVETAERNPRTIGRRYTIRTSTLLERYTKVSRD